MRASLLSVVLGCAAAICGCSKPAAVKQAAHAIESPASLASATPVRVPAPPSDVPVAEIEVTVDDSSAAGDIEPFVNIFEAPQGPPPEVVEEPQVVEVKPGIPAPPRLRLIGFVKGEQAKALVTIADELQLVKAGDKIQDLEFTSIAAPAITINYYDEEIKIDLFDQRWEHITAEPTGNSPPNLQAHSPTAPPPSPGTAGQAAHGQAAGKLPPGPRGIPTFPAANQAGFPAPPHAAQGSVGPSLPALPQLPPLPGLPATP